MMNKTTKTVKIGDNFFFLPFRQNGFWVEDAKRANVAECRSHAIADAMAKLLNDQFVTKPIQK